MEQVYQQSAEDFADEREAAFKINQTKNQSESRFEHDKYPEKTPRLKDDIDVTEFTKDEKRTKTILRTLMGSCFIVYCFSQIYRYFEERKFNKMVSKYAESKRENLE